MYIKTVIRKWSNRISNMVVFLDDFPLWWLGIVLLIVTFLPYLVLQEGSVFEIHDQLDETIMTYVLNARYLGNNIDIFPELLGGVNRTGMQPSAILFVPLYRVLPALTAFLIQYAFVYMGGFQGMYFAVKRVTGSSILAIAAAACFSALPLQPIYGLSIFGVPLLFYACSCLHDRQRLICGYLLIVLFGLTSHLVLTGYVVLGLWACYLLIRIIKNKKNSHMILGFVLLTGVYVLTNNQLFGEFLLGSGDYISHREELVNGALDFTESVRSIFWKSGQHAISLHENLVLPILGLLLLEGCLIRNKTEIEKKLYKAAWAGFVGLFAIAVFYGICRSEAVVSLKNSFQGFMRYFQAERFYWLYPAGWYFEFVIVFRILWGDMKKEAKLPVLKLLLLFVILIPSLQLIKVNCNFYRNINQINNGSGITGYISWESYYAEELMGNLEEVIGRDKSSYRIAHLGISPAPALMHGFYTVDGYSNNYPLTYKQAFRRVIAKELDKNEEVRVYYDTWGSRCYLFNSQTGSYYMVSKKSNVTYENLEFDMKALKRLGCEYLFSGGEILDASEMGLEYLGYFETEKSYWGIWLYQLTDEV